MEMMQNPRWDGPAFFEALDDPIPFWGAAPRFFIGFSTLRLPDRYLTLTTYNNGDNMNDSIDLLLMNCSNTPFNPVFPYAFIQVGALAGMRGLKVKTLDLSKLSEQQMPPAIDDYTSRFHPRMVGFTIRQLDSIIAGHYLPESYVGGSSSMASPLNFFPLENTRDAIIKVRSITDVPIVVGGTGFSTSPIEISKYLDVDFGISGEPDGLFENFDDVLKRQDLSSIPNLIHYSGGEYVENKHCFFKPFDGMEYNDEVIQDIEEFYGKDALFTLDYSSSIPLPFTRPSISVEISRGCPFHCCYCTEPLTNGTEVRYRSLDAIAEDIRFIASHGLRYLWLVCSELNMGTNEFSLSVAEQIIKINEKLENDPIVWRSYHLPRWLSFEDLRLIYRSGFLGGWNDFPAWENDNLAANTVPYKTEHILEHLGDVMTIEKERGIKPDVFSVFVGNPHTDAKSISETLRLYDDHSFAEYYGHLGFGFPATRVFECCLEQLPIRKDEITTITRQGVIETNLIHPSFHFPGYLYKTLGSIKEIFEFFGFLPRVVCSGKGLRDKDWTHFLSLYSSPEQFSGLLKEFQEREYRSESLNKAGIESHIAALITEIYKAPAPSATRDVFIPPPIHRGTKESQARALIDDILKDPTPSAVRNVFAPPPNEKQLFNTVSFILLEAVYSHNARTFREVLDFLQLPADPQGQVSVSTYKLMKQLYAQFSSTEAILKTVQNHFQFEDGSVQMFQLSYLLYLYDVRINPEYKELLFGRSLSFKTQPG